MVRIFILIMFTMGSYFIVSAQELINAISFGEYDTAKQLIAQSKGINERNEDGDTPLHAAAARINLEIAKLLIDKGADVNAVNNEGETALQHAAKNFLNGSPNEIIELFLKHGADINHSAYNGRTNLENICLMSYGDDSTGIANEKFAEFLISKGEKVNVNCSYGSNFLITAVYVNKMALVNLALQYEFDINQTDSSGMSAFLYACSNGNIELAEKFIGMGADVNAFNIYGENCMTIAAMYGQPGMIKMLLGRDFSVNRLNQYSGETPLHKAAFQGSIDMVKLLIENGADINALDNNGNTAIKIADEQGFQEIVDLLKENGGE